MPQIRINEEEVVSSSALDITDNVVFVPVFTKSEELSGKFKLYSNFSDFSTDFGGSNIVKYSYVEEGQTIARSNERSYVYAYECLLNGLKVLAYGVYTASDFTDTTTTVEGQPVINPAELQATTAMDTALTGDTSPLTSLQDKNLYNVKFITSGGYQSPQSVMITTASGRGDCLALLDLAENVSVSNLLGSSSTIVEGSKFASCFFPWCTFNFSNEVTAQNQTSSTSDYLLPGSLAYLLAYGRSVQSNANWFAASGVTRGVVPSLVAPVEEITESQMHILQGDEGSLNFYVNPIMMVGSYGYKVWGNRTTLINRSVDSYFKYLNIRMLLCDIKKTLYEASIRSTFEPNDDVTWINFKSMCSGLLDRMTSGRGLNWYRWRRVPTKKKATIEAILTISPIEAVENFDLTVMLTDQDVTVTETL